MMSITHLLAKCVMLFFFILALSCSGDKKELAPAVENRDSLPVMKTLNVETLISDSGVIRYRMKTPEWLIYDRLQPSRWTFVKGIYLEQFDSKHKVEASIKADTAYYYDKQRLWELRGHVDIHNRKGEKFNTEELFWNQSTEKVYSDKFIRIEQPERIITGHGFDSNQQMTVYTIRNMEGIFYVDDEQVADTTTTAASTTTTTTAN
jgi:LPS export ABC transporter protein LptC